MEIQGLTVGQKGQNWPLKVRKQKILLVAGKLQHPTIPFNKGKVRKTVGFLLRHGLLRETFLQVTITTLSMKINKGTEITSLLW